MASPWGGSDQFLFRHSREGGNPVTFRQHLDCQKDAGKLVASCGSPTAEDQRQSEKTFAKQVLEDETEAYAANATVFEGRAVRIDGLRRAGYAFDDRSS